jgi:hypothetical protein
MLAIAGGLGEMGEAEVGVLEFFKGNQEIFPIRGVKPCCII